MTASAVGCAQDDHSNLKKRVLLPDEALVLCAYYLFKVLAELTMPFASFAALSFSTSCPDVD